MFENVRIYKRSEEVFIVQAIMLI